MTEKTRVRSRLKQLRLLLWAIVALAIIVIAALMLNPSSRQIAASSSPVAARTSFGGPFTLVGSDGRAFSSQALEGKPYAIYFGFTRCADVCPTTLSRLVRLRREAATDQAMQIVFVTIDPSNDGPREVGQYATLFNAPIIGLTGSRAQIEQVKKQYGIFAIPVPHAAMGKQMEHTATVLLFDRAGNFAGSIAPDEGDADARAKIKKLVG